MLIPSAAKPLLLKFSFAFTHPTFERWLILVMAATLTTGRRTVLNVLRTVQTLAPGHPSSYHRVFSKRRWSLWPLARTLAGFIIEHWVPEGPIALAGDDTVDEHRGKTVYGKGCHRDAVRSTHSFTAYRWGHRWIVVAILVKFPFAARRWALPILTALYHPEKWNHQHHRRHKTPCVLMRQLLAVLIRWFPKRTFIFSGDGGFGTHDLASFAHRHRRRLTLVSRFYPDANLYDLPPDRKRKAGRPRMKGAKQLAPKQMVARSKQRHLTVAWYGGGSREVGIVTDAGHWYKAGRGLVPIRWVFVHDRTGTHRDEYFFTTDPDLSPTQLIEAFTGRWSIETTFQEMRAYVGLETTRGRTEKTVLRVAPCLFGLYSVIALLYALLPSRQTRAGRVNWAGKQAVTFSDAITAVRRWLWIEGVFATAGHNVAFAKLSRPLRAVLLYALAPAA